MKDVHSFDMRLNAISADRMTAVANARRMPLAELRVKPRRSETHELQLQYSLPGVQKPASFYYLLGGDVLETRCERMPSGAGGYRL